jgi:hypothetical protein
VQIKLMTLPPAPDDELPDLVRFQAEREFTALGSDAALDYIPISGDAQTQHQVLAIALSAAGLTEAREICQAVDGEPERITIRACATLSLVQKAGALRNSAVALVVNPLGDEADLSVLDGGTIVLMRTVRLPEGDESGTRRRILLGEIRRTIAAARQQVSDKPIDLVLVCGNESSEDQVAGLDDELGVRVEMFDPADFAPSGFASSGVAAASLGRFSAVLGMALAEADRRPPIVDFLNVRRRVEKARFGRPHAIAAAAAAAVLLIVGLSMWWRSHALSRELAQVQEKLKRDQETAKGFAEQIEQAQAIESWLATNVNWLEEMESLSRQLRPVAIPKTEEEQRAAPFPADSDVVIKGLSFNRSSGPDSEGGTIQVPQAVAKNDQAITKAVTRIREHPRFQVRTPGIGPDRSNSVPGYGRAFTLVIQVPAPEDAPPPEKKVPESDTVKPKATERPDASEAPAAAAAQPDSSPAPANQSNESSAKEGQQ